MWIYAERKRVERNMVQSVSVKQAMFEDLRRCQSRILGYAAVLHTQWSITESTIKMDLSLLGNIDD